METDMAPEEAIKHHTPLTFRKLIVVWLSLLALTVVTVLVSRADLGAGKVWGALTIASLKSALVIAFFMHLKYEARVFKVILLVALVTLALFIGVTFFDVLYR
jgi:cytochrome c oxidase subunit IV